MLQPLNVTALVFGFHGVKCSICLSHNLLKQYSKWPPRSLASIAGVLAHRAFDVHMQVPPKDDRLCLPMESNLYPRAAMPFCLPFVNNAGDCTNPSSLSAKTRADGPNAVSLRHSPHTFTIIQTNALPSIPVRPSAGSIAAVSFAFERIFDVATQTIARDLVGLSSHKIDRSGKTSYIVMTISYIEYAKFHKLPIYRHLCHLEGGQLLCDASCRRQLLS